MSCLFVTGGTVGCRAPAAKKPRCSPSEMARRRNPTGAVECWVTCDQRCSAMNPTDVEIKLHVTRHTGDLASRIGLQIISTDFQERFRKVCRHRNKKAILKQRRRLLKKGIETLWDHKNGAVRCFLLLPPGLHSSNSSRSHSAVFNSCGEGPALVNGSQQRRPLLLYFANQSHDYTK